MGMIEQFVRAGRQGVERRRAETSLEELEARIERNEGRRPFNEALTRPGLSLIAVFKRRSPSSGEILPGASVEQFVTAYEAGGAAVLSILTEEEHFGGSLEDLQA